MTCKGRYSSRMVVFQKNGSLVRKSILIVGITTFVRYVIAQLWQIPGNCHDVPRSKVAILSCQIVLNTVVAFGATYSKHAKRLDPRGRLQPSHAALASETPGSHWSREAARC
jgi:hypothetical protein